MRGLIQLAIAETNTAFELSGIATQIRLVHAYRDLEFIEDTTPDAMSNALDSLRSKTDGVLDSVHAKRALYGADIVNMIVGMYWTLDRKIIWEEPYVFVSPSNTFFSPKWKYDNTILG